MNYPEDFINKVICGDCLEVIKQIKAWAVINKKYNKLHCYDVGGKYAIYPRPEFANEKFSDDERYKVVPCEIKLTNK